MVLGVHLHVTPDLLQNPSVSGSIAGSRHQLSLSSALHADLAFLLWVFRLPSYPPSTHHAAPGRLPCRSRSCILGVGTVVSFLSLATIFYLVFWKTSCLQIVPSYFLRLSFLPLLFSQMSLTFSFNLCVLILAVIFSTLVNVFFFYNALLVPQTLC